MTPDDTVSTQLRELGTQQCQAQATIVANSFAAKFPASAIDTGQRAHPFALFRRRDQFVHHFRDFLLPIHVAFNGSDNFSV